MPASPPRASTTGGKCCRRIARHSKSFIRLAISAVPIYPAVDVSGTMYDLILHVGVEAGTTFSSTRAGKFERLVLLCHKFSLRLCRPQCGQ